MAHTRRRRCSWLFTASFSLISVNCMTSYENRVVFCYLFCCPYVFCYIFCCLSLRLFVTPNTGLESSCYLIHNGLLKETDSCLSQGYSMKANAMNKPRIWTQLANFTFCNLLHYLHICIAGLPISNMIVQVLCPIRTIIL